MKQTPADESAEPQPAHDDKRRAYQTLRTTWFDVVTSFLMALILLLGTLVLLIAVVPRFHRWQLDFAAQNVDSYARQLDHYNIELGLIGGAIQGLDYASNLSGKPRRRHGDSEAENRLYFMWSRPSTLKQFDRQLLQRAGARVERREMLKFVPPELENQLAEIELEYAMARGHDSVDSIAKTVFASESESDGYQFVVSEQRYRK